MELFKPSLCCESEPIQIKKCMEVGRLCVEMNKEDRPTIEDVLGMLNGVKELPAPKQPRGVDLARKRPSNLICPESGSLVPLVVPKEETCASGDVASPLELLFTLPSRLY